MPFYYNITLLITNFLELFFKDFDTFLRFSWLTTSFAWLRTAAAYTNDFSFSIASRPVMLSMIYAFVFSSLSWYAAVKNISNSNSNRRQFSAAFPSKLNDRPFSNEYSSFSSINI